jgi:2-C-methyl-D-erythritol 4-phosphate cytidylyltransferase/2-C-methyl-D-erythritol 2,4-cyclodiphosphate synthase
MAALPSGPVVALVVAGGRGIRAGGGVPKQYRRIAGHSILARSLRPFLDHPSVDKVAAVIHPDDRTLYDRAVGDSAKLLPPIEGGAERQESVRLGLEALAASDSPKLVLIHDAVRPFVTSGLIGRVLAGLAENPAILPALPVSDTLKRAGSDLTVETTLPRNDIYAAQTPQGFHFAAILEAHRQAAASGAAVTDDAAIAEQAGIPVRIVEGDVANRKLTSMEDISIADQQLAAAMETRVASGYDVHAIGPGDHIMLGGVRIPHDRSLVGHSDADVVLHALTDAILGTIADGDIGSHFPPSDASLKDASSDRFLAEAVALLEARGGTITHLDATIIAEAPKIGTHRDAMRTRIAEICKIPVGSVSVKATTNEGLGFLGRGEGIAALATATVRLPSVAR